MRIDGLNSGNVDTSDFKLPGGKVVPTVKEYIYLGQAFTSDLSSDVDVDRRINKAIVIRASLTDIFKRKDIGLKVKGRIYVVLVLSVLLHASECWCMKQSLMAKISKLSSPKCSHDVWY